MEAFRNSLEVYEDGPKVTRICSVFSGGSCHPVEKKKDVFVSEPSKNPDLCLNAVPNELLHQIGGHLTKKDLLSLTTVNKKLSGVAYPLLYSHAPTYNTTQNKRHAFLQKISSVPALAKMVKTIQAEYKVNQVYFKNNTRPCPITYQYLTSRDAMLLDGTLEVAMNLQHLEIKDVSTGPTDRHLEHDFGWIKMLVNAAQGTPVAPDQMYTSLKTLNISLGKHISGWLRLEELSTILRLPSLQEVTFKGLVEGEYMEDWRCPEGASNIKKLVLEASFLDSKWVRQLLTSCKALEHFAYEHTIKDTYQPLSPTDNPKSIWAQHSWAVIGEALKKHQDSLRYLNLSYQVPAFLLELARTDGRYDVDPKDLGSLKEFKKLLQLVAPIDALVCYDVGPINFAKHLPDQLEVLSVSIDETTRLSPSTCAIAIGSLLNDASQGSLKVFRVPAQRSFQTELSKPIAELSEAGVNAKMTEAMKDDDDLVFVMGSGGAAD